MSDYCTTQVCIGRTGDPPSGFAAEANILSNYCLWGHCNLQIFQLIQGSVPRTGTVVGNGTIQKQDKADNQGTALMTVTLTELFSRLWKYSFYCHKFM